MNIPSLTITRDAPPFEEARHRIRSGQLDEDAQRLLCQLSGDHHSGAGYTDPRRKQKPVPPSGRDPRWIEALRDELVRSMVQVNPSNPKETYFLAGTLASFGMLAIPALVSALEECLRAIPAESSGYRFKPVFQALRVLGSSAGVPAALALLERTKRMNIGSALDYLNDCPDPEVLPEIEKLLDRKLFGRP